MQEVVRYLMQPVMPVLPLEIRLRFSRVQPGEVYRSSQPKPHELRALVAKYNIRSVVVARREPKHHELETARTLGLHIFHFKLARNMPEETVVDKFLGMLRDTARHPVLIHCRRGRDRTGLLVLLYRVELCGWSPHDAWREMRKFGHGWFFGYSNYKPWIEERYGVKL